jgi:hypothetical protein
MIIRQLQGEHEYKHVTGEVSIVTENAVGLGHRRLLVYRLPPEIQDQTLIVCLSQYGIVKQIREEKWSPQHRYKISSGGRLVNIDHKKHVPSELYISGNRANNYGCTVVKVLCYKSECCWLDPKWCHWNFN